MGVSVCRAATGGDILLHRIALSVDTWLPKAKPLSGTHPQHCYDELPTIARPTNPVFDIDGG